MKQNLPLCDLAEFLKRQNILLSSEQIQRLELYHLELKSYANKINLISFGDRDYIIERHFLPSFYYLYHLMNEKKLPTSRILDLGTGAGFPGIILAICLPDIRITLIDSSRKKTLFLRNLISKLDIKTEIICERIEELSCDAIYKFDIVVARAVASIPVLLKWCRPIINKEGFIITLKGDNYRNEIDPAMHINFNELTTNPAWFLFSKYLEHKRMIKIWKS